MRPTIRASAWSLRSNATTPNNSGGTATIERGDSGPAPLDRHPQGRSHGHVRQGPDGERELGLVSAAADGSLFRRYSLPKFKFELLPMVPLHRHRSDWGSSGACDTIWGLRVDLPVLLGVCALSNRATAVFLILCTSTPATAKARPPLSSTIVTAIRKSPASFRTCSRGGAAGIRLAHRADRRWAYGAVSGSPRLITRLIRLCARDPANRLSDTTDNSNPLRLLPLERD